MKPLVIDSNKLDAGWLSKATAARAADCLRNDKPLDPLTKLLEYLSTELREQYPNP